jgi:hypothetical protein
MTIDELAGRLGAAAAEMEGIRGELAGAQPAVLSGQRAPEVLERIRLAWLEQSELAARVAERVRVLGEDVTRAAQSYRAADDLGRAR